jgi:antitoxin component YwqK of YwqJK toxin-antitoxin module
MALIYSTDKDVFLVRKRLRAKRRKAGGRRQVKKAVKKAPKKSAGKTGQARKPKKHEHRHKDGSLWAKGWLLDGVMVGYWEWFRKEGTRMRSGHFDNGVQVGEWITYDRNGDVYKVTRMKPKGE